MSNLREHQFHLFPSLLETLEYYDQNHDAHLFAGGTDIMVQLAMTSPPSRNYLSLGHLAELQTIEEREDEIEIGACCTFSQILSHSAIKTFFPLIGESSATIGASAIQNRATIGGNIANASPAADTPPVLLAYDAQLVLCREGEQRRCSYDRFHLGYKKMDLRKGEIIKSIILKKPSASLHVTFFRKVGTRQAMSIAKVGFAGRIDFDQNKTIVGIGLGFSSIAPTPFKALEIENFLRGKKLNQQFIDDAIKLFSSTLAPIDDIRSNKLYRTKVAENLLQGFLQSI